MGTGENRFMRLKIASRKFCCMSRDKEHFCFRISNIIGTNSLPKHEQAKV